MWRHIAIGAVVAVLAFAGVSAWKIVHVPQLPPRPLADVGEVKSDLFEYARAERAFYASKGRYASMQELRSQGLISVPPDIRWPYFYSIHTPAPDRFVIVAIAKGPFGSRPIALAIDEKMDMRELRGHRTERHRRAARRMRFS